MELNDDENLCLKLSKSHIILSTRKLNLSAFCSYNVAPSRIHFTMLKVLYSVSLSLLKLMVHYEVVFLKCLCCNFNYNVWCIFLDFGMLPEFFWIVAILACFGYRNSGIHWCPFS